MNYYFRTMVGNAFGVTLPLYCCDVKKLLAALTSFSFIFMHTHT